MRPLLSSRLMLLRHPVAAVLAPLVVASGVAGFLSGQVAGHFLPHGLALTHPVAHQASGHVQGSLGQHVKVQVAHQPVVRTVYVPQVATVPRVTASNSSAHAMQSSSHGKGDKGNKGDKGGKGDHGHGKGDHGGHGGHGNPGNGNGDHGGWGHGGDAGGKQGRQPAAPPTHHKHGK